LIHEFGHELSVLNFQPDFGVLDAGTANDALVDAHCKLLIERPWINTLAPTSGGAGTQVTITGGNFLPSQGPSTVTFYNGTPAAGNGKVATATSWSENSIVVTVPNGVQTGFLDVVVYVRGEVSNTAIFSNPN
jgi:IPT/TIG domain